MANQAEVTETLKRAAAKQEKTIAEIGTLKVTVTDLNTEVTRLQGLIEAAGSEVSQELKDSADKVEQLATQADDQIPDLQPIPTP